jgi:glycosyltransferase involved in cell wall biosynthesis
MQRRGVVTGPANCALSYVPEAFDGDRPGVLGRQSAGDAFLKAMARHGAYEALYCAGGEGAFSHFQERLRSIGGAAKRAIRVDPEDAVMLSEIGCVYHAGPLLAREAWVRNRQRGESYSLCGITHSLASERVLAAICDFLIAPMQPWDALICTCQAAQDVVLDVLGQWAAYLESRGMAPSPSTVQLPVIPLGVHVEQFERTGKATAKGAALRKALGIADDDIVLLYYGRLDFRTKSHPTPLLRACELAQKFCHDKTLHLLMAGQFQDLMNASEFAVACSMLAPSYRVHWLDGKDAERMSATWFAADMFISLPDNIQETFGLTPVEAMASSLPCIVSDWSGYKESVVDGVTGFRVPTMMAPAGVGEELMSQLLHGKADPLAYIGGTAQFTAVDIDKCARSIAVLAGSADLRQRFGRAGRHRVEQHFAWRRIIGRYQELWAELADRRSHAGEARPATRPVGGPFHADAFRIFSGYPSAVLSEASRVTVADVDGRFVVERLRSAYLHDCARDQMLDLEGMSRLLALVGDDGATVTDILAGESVADRAVVLRSLMWMYKFGLVSIDA